MTTSGITTVQAPRLTRSRRIVMAALSGAILTLGVPLVATSAGATPAIQTFSSLLPQGPEDLTISANGSLCVAGSNQRLIYGVDSAGNQSTFFSDHSNFDYTWGTAVGPDGNLYVSNESAGTIYQITPTGQETLFASGISDPVDLAFSPAGDLYVGTYNESNQIFKVTPSGSVSLYLGNNGPGLAFDPSGNLFTTNVGTHKIDEYNHLGVYVSSTPVIGFSYDSSSIAIGKSGDLYLADQHGTIFQIVGNAVVTIPVPGGDPVGLAFDSSGSLYEVNWHNGTIGVINGLESGFGGFLYHTFDCAVSSAPTVPLNLKVTRNAGTVAASWLGTYGDWYLCTLTYGTQISSMTDRVTQSNCSFSGLSLTGNYGVSVIALNSSGASPPVQAAAPAPKLITITCVRGKSIRRVTGVSPRCPPGYHRH